MEPLLESLANRSFNWAKAHALAKVSDLCYEDPAQGQAIALSKWGFQTCQFFKVGDTQGLVASTPDALVVGFRGTKEPRTWLKNIQIQTVEEPYYRVHQGFFKGFNLVRDIVWEKMEAVEPNSKMLWLTGHSYGGALATILATEFSGTYKPDGIYTFGQPCTGKEDFAYYFDWHFHGRSFRFVYGDDVITKLPPGYSHVKSLVQLGDQRSSANPQGPELLTNSEFDQLQQELEDEELRGKALGLLGKLVDHDLELYLNKLEEKLLQEPDLTKRWAKPDLAIPRLLKSPIKTAKAAPPKPPPYLAKLEALRRKQPESLFPSPAEQAPLSVHIVWSQHEAKDGPSPVVAKSLFEFLSHRLENQPNLEAGVGIPVYAGHHFDAVEKKIANLQEWIKGYDLQLRSYANADALPQSGRSLAVMARSGEGLLFKGFDSNGEPFERSEADIPSRLDGQRHQLRKLLDSIFLNKEEEDLSVESRQTLLDSMTTLLSLPPLRLKDHREMERLSASLVVVVLLDKNASVDDELKAFANRIFYLEESLRKKVHVIPVILNATSSIHLPSSLIASAGAAFLPNYQEKAKLVCHEVAVEICHLLMNNKDAADIEEQKRVRIFISYARADEERSGGLATKIRDRIGKSRLKSFFDKYDLDRGESLDQLSENQKRCLTLVVRTDSYAESPYCQAELLKAKQLGMPLVFINALSKGEDRGLVYGGNSINLVAEGGKVDERFLDECLDACLKAWLRHLHFGLAARVTFNRQDIPLQPTYLSRPPELLDFAQGPLSGQQRMVLIYPDPPLPLTETDLMRKNYPNVRFATPSMLAPDILRKTPVPPLDGWQIALSLSDSPDLAADIEHVSVDLKGSREAGLLRAHLNGAIAYLTLALARSGAELGYGGHLNSMGHTQLISDLIKAHRRSRASKGESFLLHSYVAAFLWEDNLKKKDNDDQKRWIEAHFHRIPEYPTPAATNPVDQAHELATMRTIMAEKSDARVIMGGKSWPNGDGEYQGGYLGRLPGQAEEAIKHLLAGKPIYVAGGFGGASEMVSNALQGQLEFLPKEYEPQKANDIYRNFCSEYDLRHPLKLKDPTPSSLDELWDLFSDFGRGVFHDKDAKHPDEQIAWIDNGLSPSENRRLFQAVEYDEIGYLVTKGLRTLAKAKSEDSAHQKQLQISLFNGPLEEALDIEAYAVWVLGSATLRGADGALDTKMEGGLRRALEEGEKDTTKRNPILPTHSDQLFGDYVILQQMGDFSELLEKPANETNFWLMRQVEGGVCEIVSRAAQHGVESLALVPFAVNLGLEPKQSVEAILNGLLQMQTAESAQEGGNHRLNSVTVCENDSGRYQLILDFFRSEEKRKERAIAVQELPPKISVQDRSPLFLSIRENEGAWLQFARAPGSSGAVPHDPVRIEASATTLAELAADDSSSPHFEHQADWGSTLARQLFSGNVADAIQQNRDRPWDILHDEQASTIPFELLCFDVPGAEPFRPALDCGMRRGLLTGSLPSLPSYRRRGSSIQLLLVANPTGDLAGAEREAQAIMDAFKDSTNIVVTAMPTDGSVTKDGVMNILRTNSFDLVHYAGHGNFDPADPSRNGLKFDQNAFLTAADLSTLPPDSVPMLVFLNACQVGNVTNTAKGGASLAQSILRAGVRGFLSNRWNVSDHSAELFAISLYRDLIEERPLGEAITRARSKLFASKRADWANYVFYGSPEIRL